MRSRPAREEPGLLDTASMLGRAAAAWQTGLCQAALCTSCRQNLPRRNSSDPQASTATWVPYVPPQLRATQQQTSTTIKQHQAQKVLATQNSLAGFITHLGTPLR